MLELPEKPSPAAEGFFLSFTNIPRLLIVKYHFFFAFFPRFALNFFTGSSVKK
ncbi:TPA: hypothetical protein I8Y12_001051 [Raoultella planticola]|nr:hypothetical protein [Raoultella planticola]